MGRTVGIVLLAMVFGLVGVFPASAEVIDLFSTITVNVTIPGSTALTVETHNRSDDALVVPLTLNFSGIGGIGLPPAGNPWVVSDQYIRITYSSNYGLWGVRIVTDNEDLEGDPNDVIDSIAGARIGAGIDGIWGNADDLLAYSGLLSLTDIARPLLSQDPSRRAPWAWQVFSATQPVITPPSSIINPDGSLGDSLVGAWDANWGYLADKNDFGFNADILEDGDGDGSVDDAAYPVAVVGGGGGGGSLAQHPAASPKPGDGDIAIYIAARFANTRYGGAAPTPYLLAADSYQGSLYVELIHE